MSTKMYELYHYKGSRSLASLYRRLVEMRKQYLTATLEQVVKPALARGGYSRDRLEEQMRQNTRIGLRSLFNIDASAMVYLHEDEFYVQFFGLPHAFYENEVEQGVLVDCSYQNSSDQPDDVSDEEWAARRLLVDALIDEVESRPSRNGLIFLFADEKDIFPLINQAQREIRAEQEEQKKKEGEQA